MDKEHNPQRLLIEFIEVPRHYSNRCVVRFLLTVLNYDLQSMSSILSVTTDKVTASSRSVLIETATAHQIISTRVALTNDWLKLDARPSISVKAVFPIHTAIELNRIMHENIPEHLCVKMKFRRSEANWNMRKLLDVLHSVERNYYHLSVGKEMAFVQASTKQMGQLITESLKDAKIQYTLSKSFVQITRSIRPITIVAANTEPISDRYEDSPARKRIRFQTNKESKIRPQVAQVDVSTEEITNEAVIPENVHYTSDEIIFLDQMPAEEVPKLIKACHGTHELALLRRKKH
jgi:hypothetical protein